MSSILMVGAECAPFAKTGGLADVIGVLPGELKTLGYDVRVMLPLHAQIKRSYAEKLEHVCSFYVHLGWRTQYAGVEKLECGGVVYYFIDNEYYFGGPIYKGGEAEGEQYSFFSRAVLEALPLIDFIPDVLHANDWHTGMIPMLIKTQYGNAPQGAIKTLFTIHNIGYQGKFSVDFVKDLLGIPNGYFTPDYIEAYGSANFLKAALVFADALNTVSPTYACELQDAYFAEGMEGMLQKRKHDLVGILNGIDTHIFNPATDQHIAAPYTEKDLAAKQTDKRALLKELSLTVSDDTPVIGMVTRLTAQKGLDLVVCVLEELLQREVALVILGSGETQYEHMFMDAAYRHCGRMAVRTEYNDPLAHRIYAGADFFLMPSRFEPCGISQMIALRYGTLPIVRETGGLADTVFAYNEYTGEGNGFSFANFNAHDMLHVIDLALRIYQNKSAMHALMKNAMREDYSFTASAKEYAALYESMLQKEI